MSGEGRPHYSSFRSRMTGGQKVVGSFIKTQTTHATEIFGALGYDFIVIDEEHAPIDRAMTDVMVLAARASGGAARAKHDRVLGRRVRAEFPLVLTDFGISPPEYLGVGVGSKLLVKAQFPATPAPEPGK